MGVISAPATGGPPKRGGGRALRFAESDEESVDVRVAALPRDGFNLLFGCREQLLRKIQPHVADLLTGGAVQVLAEGLVQPAARHARGSRDVFDADCTGEM